MNKGMTMGDMDSMIAAEFDRRATAVRSYFTSHAERLAAVCHRMAERFVRGGRILAFGLGSAATDAQHVSVEFVHPVIVGKRALPAIALPNDAPTILGTAANNPASVFVHQIEVLGRADDIAMGFLLSSDDPGAAGVTTAMERAADMGMLTIGFTGPYATAAEHSFTGRELDPFIVQELQETAYHVLWELVHVFLEHQGRAQTGREVGAAGFLYPFLSEARTSIESLLEHVRQSILRKADDVVEIRNASAAKDGAEFVAAAHLLVERFDAGGKVLAFGNGGSATDAQDLVTDFVAPPRGLVPRPALALTNDAAVVTAVGNDVGFDNVFARQVIAHGRPEDVAVGMSTSGSSRNVIAAFEEARRRGMSCIGFAGYGGGETLARALCDATFVIDHEYIPRIQEAQASQYHILRRLSELASN